MSALLCTTLGVAELAPRAARAGRSPAVEADAASASAASQRPTPTLGAFLARAMPKPRLAQARAADAAPRRRRRAAPLAGVPIAHKDIFVTRGLRHHRRLEDAGGLPQPFDATVVARAAAPPAR